MHYFVIVLQAAACAFITANAVLNLNRMTAKTAPVIRYAYAILAAAGVAGTLSCFMKSDWFDCLFAVGIALFLGANRRNLNVKPGPAA